MNRRIIFISLLTAFLWVGCSESKSSPSGPAPKAPAELAKGGALQHPLRAMPWRRSQGDEPGPTFLSKIYEPSHHGDAAFQMAPQRGVRAHHWNFGDMPKIEAVQPEEVNEIIRYVRWLQKEAGIF